MSVAVPPPFAFDNTFVRELAGLYEPWRAAAAPAPELLLLNDALATALGADPAALRRPEGVAALVGDPAPTGAEPVAQAYSGHQFGGFSPRLGDGRALLLGEVLDADGARRDLHLKGSGRTPFARGGDGKAAVGPMVREYVVSEAMHALGIPTTRALAVVATGDRIVREGTVPGAVLVRVAASHLRVGTFEWVKAHGDEALLRRLADHAIARHHPHAADAAHPYLAFYESVVAAQAELIARWMLVGFVHGVMNTDNMAISGETIDYGPCAFMDAFDADAVYSSIDHAGRYAWGNQPAIAQWNLARLGEALLPLLAAETGDAVAAATAVLQTFPERNLGAWRRGLAAKLGLADDADAALGNDLLALMAGQRADLTSTLRALATTLRDDTAPRGLAAEPDAFSAWARRWREAITAQGSDPREAAAAMDRVNPAYVPRNHLVEEALAAATAGDLAPTRRLLDVLAAPFDERPDLAAYAAPAPASFGAYRTFCGT